MRLSVPVQGSVPQVHKRADSGFLIGERWLNSQSGYVEHPFGPQNSVAVRVRPGAEDVISPAARSRSISAAPASTNRSTMRSLRCASGRRRGDPGPPRGIDRVQPEDHAHRPAAAWCTRTQEAGCGRPHSDAQARHRRCQSQRRAERQGRYAQTREVARRRYRPSAGVQLLPHL